MTIPAVRKKQWRIVDLIKWGEEFFSSKSLESPRREIEWLLTDLLSLSRVDLYMQFNQIVSKEHLSTLKTWIRRRSSGEPLQYITGKTEFFSLPIHVNEHVLIPRSETERLVEVCLDHAHQIKAKTVIDIGTGSGCIAIALATKLQNIQIVAVDSSEEALTLARKNAQLSAVDERISFMRKDVLSDDIPGKFDIIVSNPPYVRKEEIENLAPSIKDFEPIRALTDGLDGLEFYRCFASHGRKWVHSNGVIVLEVGLGSHPIQVQELFKQQGFPDTELFQDYNGDDRVICIKVTG